MEPRFVRYRAGLYVLLSVAVLCAAVFGMMAETASSGTATYSCMLFMLCAVPILWMERFNDRYALLGAFMATYFMLFGALSLRNVLLGSDVASVADRTGDFMTTARIAVLIGAVLVLVGYRYGCSLIRPVTAGTAETDFSNFSVLAIGVACWTLGSAAMAYYAIVVTPENSVRSTQQGFAIMGPLLTFAVMLGQLIQPLGIVLLAYGYAKNRTPLWLGLVLAVVFLQLILGFVTDTKGTALLGILMVALTQTLWDSKVSKGWAAGVLVFALLVFPVMQASRVERGERGLNRAQAFEKVTETLARAWESRDKVNEGKSGQRAQTFLERSSGEAALEPLFDHAGVDTPFLRGKTLVALPFAFVPRLLLPDKEDVPVGQLYNHVFLHAASDDFTYISLSQLGEFYWNFGWPGVVLGMLLTGFLLGILGAKSNLAEVHSLTRLLILLITIKMLCLGFGGSIALIYIVWMRAVAAIGLLHLMFARRAVATTEASGPLVAQPTVAADSRGALPLFPNMMR